MKRYVPFFVIYVLVHSTSGDSVRTYEGQSTPIIMSNVASEGKTGEMISEKQFNEFIEAQKLSKEVVSESNSVEQATANLDMTDTERIDFIMQYLGI